MTAGKHVPESSLPRPTAAELEILRMLWKLGPSTVRQVHTAMNETGSTGYTTVLKFLQIMHQKGLVVRDDSHRAHVYRARLSKDKTQDQITRHLVDKVFDGSRSQLVLHVLGDSKATPEELAQVRDLLDRLERTGT